MLTLSENRAIYETMWKPMNSSQNEKYFKRKLYRKSKLTFYVDTVSENRAIYETMWKHSPKMTT